MAERDEELMEELEEEIIELVDENGDVVKFKLIDVIEYKGVKYVLLLAAEENDEIAADEVAIFILNEKEETLDIIEDDALLEEVYEYYCNTASEDDN